MSYRGVDGLQILIKAISKARVYHISPVRSEVAVPLKEIRSLVDRAVMDAREELNDTEEAHIVT